MALRLIFQLRKIVLAFVSRVSNAVREMHQVICPTCKGGGIINRFVDDTFRMRDMRATYGISLREVARRMKISAMYLSQLESGKRTWSPEQIADFKASLTTVTKNKTKKGR